AAVGRYTTLTKKEKGYACIHRKYVTDVAAKAPKPPLKLLLTVPEAATALSLCRAAVYELVLAGELASVKIGRARRIPLTVLEDFIARHLRASLGEGR